MVSYDPSVIESFAETLYAQAKWIMIRYAIGFAVVGFLVGFIPLAISSKEVGSALLAGGLVAFAGLLIGTSNGRAKAFALRLQAQQALCQVQVEKNTRVGATLHGAQRASSGA